MSSYLKTAIYNALGEASQKVMDWDIQFAIVESQRVLAALLPWQMAPEIVAVDELAATLSGSGTASAYGLLDINVDAIQKDGFAFVKPSTCMDVIGIAVDTTDYNADTHKHATTTPATEVSVAEFMHRISTYSSTKSLVYCSKGNYILANFRPGSGYPSSANGLAATITYKKSPRSTPMLGGAQTTTLSLNVGVTGGTSYATSLNKSTSNYPGIRGTFLGGMFVQSVDATDPASVLSTNKIANILDIYDVRVWSGSWQDRIRIVTDIALNSWSSSPCLLVARPSSDSSVFPIDESYLNDKWNGCIVDHALSSLWMIAGDSNRATAYMNSFVGKLQLMGVKVGGVK